MSEQGGTEPTVPRPDDAGADPLTPREDPAPAPDAAPAAGAAPASPAAPEPQPVAAPLVSWDAPVAASPAPPVPPAPAPHAPLVAWAPPPAPLTGGASGGSYAGGPPPFTVGALLSDTFARYGADLLRLFLVAVAASAISWIASAVSMPPPGSNPFIRPRGFVDVRGLLGLASFVIGLIASSTMFALAEGGPSLPTRRAIRRGIERAGWVFLTSLLLVVGFLAVFLLALIPTALFAVMSPRLVIFPVLVLVALFIWASLRLSLALPAAVADNLNSIEALKVSWRVTRPVAVWGRVLAAAFLLGLLFVPAAIGTMILAFPALFGTLFGSTAATAPAWLLLLVPAIVFSIFTPLTALLTFSAYRRLVAPLQPSWTTQPQPPGPSPVPGDAPTPSTAPRDAPIAAPVPTASLEAVPASAAAPAFRVPRLGTAAKALLALAIIADVGGILAIPYGVGEMARMFRDFRGFPGFTPGTGLPDGGRLSVPGQVTFSANVDLATCTASFPLFVTSRTSEVNWLAVPRTPLTPQDEVFLRVTRDGEELSTTLQPAGTYDCIGSTEPVPDLRGGVYTYDLIVNGSSSATGTLIVQ